ncbi:MAG TPA: hypothetical protein VM689_02995 [Aliidongia sp.]|nr:hypothetical protein [Aliidongia sp.]
MKRIALSLVALCAALPALAEDAPAAHIRGTVASIDGDKLTIAGRDGKNITVTLAADVKITGIVKSDLDQVKTGTFIGTAETETGPDQGRSLEVVVFPEAARGMGEGHYPWDLQPKSLMTNGTVGKVAEGSSGRELEVAFHGYTRHITVPPNTPIVTFADAGKADLKTGAAVFFTAPKEPGDAVTRVVVGKDGATPPM